MRAAAAVALAGRWVDRSSDSDSALALLADAERAEAADSAAALAAARPLVARGAADEALGRTDRALSKSRLRMHAQDDDVRARSARRGAQSPRHEFESGSVAERALLAAAVELAIHKLQTARPQIGTLTVYARARSRASERSSVG